MKLKVLAFWTMIVAYILIVFGGFVASSNSGMGCGPDWPLCNCLLIPILKGATLIEFTHRVIGAILTGLTILLYLKILRADVESKVRFVALGMLVLLLIQVVLGAVVVFLDTPAFVVSIHLIIAMIYLFILLWIWRKTMESDSNRKMYIPLKERLHKSVIMHLNFILFLLILTLAFGAYIKHQSYGLACGWLGCRDTLLPFSIPEILQTIHRGLAVVTAVYIVLLALLAIFNNWESSLKRRLVVAAFSVMIQVLIGVGTIVKNIEIPWAVLHLAVGTAVFAFISEARIFLGSSLVKMDFIVNRTNPNQSIE